MMQIRARPLVKGMLSFVVPGLRSSHHPEIVGTASSRYCYTVFLHHFSHLARFNGGRLPRVIVELGPGHSLGTALAGVIAGAERCIGLDLEDHTRRADNLRVFDELVALFRARTPVPREIPIATVPADWGFPEALEAGLERALDERRLARIRRDIETGTGESVAFEAPWSDRAALEAESVDWLFSNAVMQHVDDVAAVYDHAQTWLAPGGFMTHEIDFSSHQLTRDWNGHWAIQPGAWKLIRGARPYLINRHARADQLEAMRRHGFRVLEEIRVDRDDGLERHHFVEPYALMSQTDARTHFVFVVCQKPDDAGKGHAD